MGAGTWRILPLQDVWIAGRSISSDPRRTPSKHLRQRSHLGGELPCFEVKLDVQFDLDWNMLAGHLHDP